MIIKIPFRTPSVNHLYFVWQGRRIKTTEARKLEKEIKEIVVPLACDIPQDKPLKVVCSIHEDWYCKNGSIRRVDVANREKFIIDSVFAGLGIDDKNIFSNTMIKVQDCEQEFTVIDISLL